MKLKTLIIVFTSIFILLNSSLLAQDVRSVDPNSLSESDIKKIQGEIRNAGLSVEEAVEMARQRGASEQQIVDMQRRIQEMDSNGTSSGDYQFNPEDTVQKTDTSEISKRRAEFKDTLQTFGSYLFNNKNLTFEPNLNIQTPKDYEINIGDQVIINIWGNSQNNYQLTVNSDGQIMIPELGPVFVAGMTFEKAEEKIKQRLTGIYADMGSDNPETFAQINMGRLRSIKINLTGEVQAPGTYTLPVTATVFNALYLSGGPNEIGSFRNIRIIRDNEVFKTIDIYKFLIDANISENIALQDEDIVFVPPADKKVIVSGEFKRTGIFEMKAEEKLNELIRFSGGFTEDANWTSLKIYRKGPEGKTILDVPFDETGSTMVQNGDSIFNGRISGIFQNRITINGAVYRPGEYEWKEGITLRELIIKADSLRKDAFMNRATITRLNPDSTTTNISVNLEQIIEGEENPLLQPEDIVLIKSRFEVAEIPHITVSGEVLEPKSFIYSDNLTLGDAIFEAGGFTEAADSSFIEVARRLSYDEASELSDQMVHIFTFNLSRDLRLNKEDANFKLRPFDQISVRRAPGFRESASASVGGEVKYAGLYSIENKNQRISDLIDMAGGLTRQSFLEGATLSRSSEELGEEFVAIDLKKIMDNPKSSDDLYLRNGDNLYIPEFMQTVKITGEVQNPFSLTYEEGKSLMYYIDKCGGFGSDAMKRKVYVKYPNGATASTKSFIVKAYPEVLPGSQIVVPSKPEREGIETNQWLAIASTFSSIAVAIAAVLR